MCAQTHSNGTHTHSAIDSRDVTHMKPDDGMDPDQRHLLQQQYHPPPPPPQRRPAAPKNAKGNAISFTHRLHEPFGMPFEGYGTAKGPADGRTFGRGEYSFCTRQRIGHSGPRAGQDLELPSPLPPRSLHIYLPPSGQVSLWQKGGSEHGLGCCCSVVSFPGSTVAWWPRLSNLNSTAHHDFIIKSALCTVDTDSCTHTDRVL